MILAGIVTFNPDLDRLEENILSVITQVDKLIIVDNASANINRIEELLAFKFQDVNLIRNDTNMGIAYALNQEAQYCLVNGYSWLLSLDQDSVIPKGLISEYEKYVQDESIGMLTCKVVDRNFGELEQSNSQHRNVEEVSLCITSASLLRVAAWQKVGGYFEPMFIDGVDFDMCYLLMENGYKILKLNNVSFLHEVGKSKKTKFLGKEVQYFNHSPLRNYYIFRNNILLGLRHRLLFHQILLSLRLWIVMNIHEDNLLKKNIMIIKGLWHAIKGKYGKYKE